MSSMSLLASSLVSALLTRHTAGDSGKSQADSQREAGSTTITAQNSSVIIAPQLTDVNAGRDINFHTTYVHPPARTDETNVPPKTEENIPRCQAELKSYLENETNKLFQGAKALLTPLDNIYTELYITEGGSGEVNSEHEVIELECKRRPSEEKKISLNDIFRPLSNNENSPQRVLTKGIAGIGKTVAVQKFTHDWATGKANQTFQFIFPFTFRELNLIKDKSWSLQSLINHYFQEVKNLSTSYYSSSSVLFIFDGLDESTIPLDFKKNKLCRSVTEPTTLDVLLTNLIKGKLLPKASVWITSRPAAATKIPPEFIHRVTDVRGFNDEQKEEYFKKEVKEEDMAQKILDHLQSKLLRSLFIMCHIPLFCEISATVLLSLLRETPKRELPKTLTEMYIHFLIIQTKRKREKDYQLDETDKDLIMKLGKLAFEQLEKGNVIFYEEDLRNCQIDLKQAAEYSGVCTKILRRESGLHQREVYSFIHLTVQEFLAALYVLETFLESGENLLPSQMGVRVASENGEIPIILLHKSAVAEALGHDYGHWDLFLRFLLGLSQDKNQELLHKELHFKGRRLPNNLETINHIHNKIKQLSDTDKSINLFNCLNELGDQSLVEQVQTYMSSGDRRQISPSHWSALAFALVVSNEDLDVFDLKKYYESDVVLERLLPVLKASKIALLRDCQLIDRSYKHISSALCFKSSRLEKLDLSGSKLNDAGVKSVSDGLKSLNCKLQNLRLAGCWLTESGCAELASSLMSNPAHMRVLDLTGNILGASGVRNLSEFLAEPLCRLETLILAECHFTESDCAALVSSLKSNPAHMRVLDLTRNSFGDDGVRNLSEFLALCRLETLQLAYCRFRESGCAALVSSLMSNPAHMRVLDLTENNFRDDGVRNFSEFLAVCRLETLILAYCGFTVRGCAALASSLKSNPAHMRVLDLTGNFFGDAGVRNLSEFLAVCRLKTLKLSGCTERDCEFLASALRSNPSFLTELVLTWSDLGESGVNLLTDLKEDSRYKLQKLMVTDGGPISEHISDTQTLFPDSDFAKSLSDTNTD